MKNVGFFLMLQQKKLPVLLYLFDTFKGVEHILYNLLFYIEKT